MFFYYLFITIIHQKTLIGTFRNSLVESSRITTERYSIVIDAGSTGTRLNIYGFLVPGNIISYYHKVKMNPGMHTLKKRNDIKKYINEILKSATAELAKDGINIKYVPIVFQGTAGLRSLNEKKRNKMFKYITEVFNQHHLNLNSIDIISGYDEGIFALHSLNLLIQYNNNVLYDYGCSNYDLKNYLEEISGGFCDMRFEKQKYHGIIDMGGGSVQIAYEFSTEDKYADPIHVIHSLSKNIYINFFPGWGLNEGIKVLKINSKFKLIDKSGNKLTMFDKLLDDFRLNNKPDINNVDELYLLSYFYDKFKKLGCQTKTSLKEIKVLINEKCRNNDISYDQKNRKSDQSEESHDNSTDFCDEVYYLYKFLDVQGMDDNKMLILVSDIDGINLNWSLSRGMKMIQ